jgi:hypothetical protein
MFKRIKLISLVALALPISICNAEDSLALAGFESAKNNGYYYVGFLNAFEGSRIGNGYVQRFWVDYLTYQYNNGTSDINAKAPGLSYSLGYQKSTDTQSWGAYLGLQGRRTNLTPDDPGNDSRGNQSSLVIALDGRQKIVNNLAVEFMGNYAPNTGYWSRARIPIGSTVKTGPEYVIQGNPNYQNQKIGWFISDIDIGSGFKTGVKAGYSKNNSLGGSMYFGLDLTKYIE